MGLWITFTWAVAASGVGRAADPLAREARGAAAAPVAVEPAADAASLPDNAAHSARSKELLGANCSFTTGMTARRVLEEGAPFSWVGPVTPTDNALPSRVAAPYRVEDGVLLVATAVLEAMVQEGLAGAKLRLEGRSLELDGVRYVVLTAFARVDT